MVNVPLTNYYFVFLPTAKDCIIPFEDPSECQKFIQDYFKVQRVIWSRLDSIGTIYLETVRVDFDCQGCHLSLSLSKSLDDDDLLSFLSNFFSVCHVLLSTSVSL